MMKSASIFASWVNPVSISVILATNTMTYPFVTSRRLAPFAVIKITAMTFLAPS